MFRINYLAVISRQARNDEYNEKNKHNEKIFFSYIIEYQRNSICTE